jgi:hypothetical protein
MWKNDSPEGTGLFRFPFETYQNGPLSLVGIVDHASGSDAARKIETLLPASHLNAAVGPIIN